MIKTINGDRYRLFGIFNDCCIAKNIEGIKITFQAELFQCQICKRVFGGECEY